MTDDLLRQMARLQSYASRLQGLIEDAQQHAPGQVVGEDATGAVRVRVAADGIPDSIEVDDAWRQMLSPERLDQAVLEAAHAAMESRMAAWSRALEGDDWEARARALRNADPDDDTHVRSQPAVGGAPVGNPTGRSLEDLTEEVIRALSNAESLGQGAPLLAEGSSPAVEGAPLVTLGAAGLSNCTIPAQWATTRSGAEIGRSLTAAVAAARSDLARRTEAARADQQAAGLDDLLGDALAALADPQRLGEVR